MSKRLTGYKKEWHFKQPGKEYTERDKKDIQDCLVSLVEDGLSLTAACHVIGVKPSAAENWRKRAVSFDARLTAAASAMSRMAYRVWKKEIKKGNFEAARSWLRAHEKTRFSERSEVDQNTKMELNINLVDRFATAPKNPLNVENGELGSLDVDQGGQGGQEEYSKTE